jgi:hypothetical protein
LKRLSSKTIYKPENDLEQPLLLCGVVQRNEEEDEEGGGADQQRGTDGLEPNASTERKQLDKLI